MNKLVNNTLNIFNSIVKIKVEGKNINNFIKRIISSNINIYNLTYISHSKAILIIEYDDYKKIMKNKTIYEITIIDNYGKLKLKEIFNKNLILFIMLFLGIIFIVLLSNIIFNIEILHNDKEIIKIIKNELADNNIKKYTFKKNYEELEKIESKILKNNKEKIEWIEIDVAGTKYIISVERRKINKNKEELLYQNIIAKKNAVIESIETTKGEKIKNNLQYVNKGDVIVSGILNKTNGEKIYVKAEGQVLGEVWYTIDIEYPFTYKEEILTGNKKKVLSFNFLNKKISLFNFNKFNTFNTKSKLLFSNLLIPFSVSFDQQYEVKVINEIYTDKEVENKAKELAKNKLLEKNKDIIDFKNISILSSFSTESKVNLKIFISAIEDITDYQNISIGS